MNYNEYARSTASITIKEGFLVKRGHLRHNWKTRWFKLSDTSLRYYKSKSDEVPQGRIPLTKAKLSMYPSDRKNDNDREFVMQISTKDGKIYPIQAPSNEELKIWMQYIHDIIEHLELDNESFQNHFMPHLPENVDTGDLPTSEILGSYIDAFGDINTENRCIDGQERNDGFSGIGFRVWLEHTLGLEQAKAESFAIELLEANLITLTDGGADTSVFSNDRYYIITGEEKSLKKVVEMYQPELRSVTAGVEFDNDEYLPPEIQNASAMPSAVLPGDLPSGEIVKRGILFKKGHIVQNWKVRCFVLQRYPHTLSYFDQSKKAPKVLNSLSLRGASVHFVDDAGAQTATKRAKERDSHMFRVDTADGISYFIMASSIHERHEWVESIKVLCHKSHGSDKST